MKRALLLAIFVLGFAVYAGAQPVVNPAKVAFVPSADHALVDTYDLGYFATGASAPIQQVAIAKSALTPVASEYQFIFPRLLFGVYTVKLRACATVNCSDWAEADKQADVRPFPPTAVRFGQ